MTIALPPHPRWGTAVEAYAYERTDGTPCAQAKYRNGSSGPKHCSWWVQGTDGQWYVSHGDAKLARLKPYRWPLLDNPHSRNEPIVLCEGPKDADALITLGFVASDHRAIVAEHAEWYRDRDVVIVQDRDPPSSAINGGGYHDHQPGRHTPGERAAAKTKRLLAAVARRIAIVEMPGGDGIKDPAQWIAAHPGTSSDKARILAELFRQALAQADGASKRRKEAGPQATEDGIGLRFAEVHADALRHVAIWSKWLSWDGTRWRDDDTLVVFDLVRAQCREARKALPAKASEKLHAILAAAKTVAAVERLAKSDRRLAATVDQWDRDLDLLNTPGGVVDLRTGEVRPHDPADYTTKIAAVAPAPPGTDCPMWRAFLDRIMAGDSELIGFLQRVAGYALTGLTIEHALFFCHGGGGNGKGVFLNTLTGVLGDYATVAPMETFTATNTERHPTDMAMLRGARLVAAQETEEGRRWAEARIKALTGGDPITARFMRQDFFTFQPQFKLLIAGNHKPSLRGVDEAIRRRFNLIPFKVTIPQAERDLGLQARLRAEWPAILRWAIDGCLEWRRRGLDQPQAVRSATDEYLSDEDAFGQWIDESISRQTFAFETSSDLYASWKRWAEQAGLQPGSQKSFVQALEGHGFVQQRTNKRRGFKGIRLNRPDYTEDPRYGG